MRHRIHSLIRALMLFPVLVVLSSCEEEDPLDGILANITGPKNFGVGYKVEKSKFYDWIWEKVLGRTNDQESIVYFTSEADEDAYAQMGASLGDDYQLNQIEYSEDGLEIVVKGLPDGTSLKDSDCNIVEGKDVVSVSKKDKLTWKLKFKKLGEFRIAVRAKAKGYECVKTFRIRVTGTIDLRLYVTPFWLSGRDPSAPVKLRYKPRQMPEGYKKMVVEMSDSVEVVAYCRWWDVEKYGNKEQVSRDTIRLGTDVFYTTLKKGFRKKLRDITKTCKAICATKIRGSHYENTASGLVIKAKDYYYEPESVILHLGLVPDNPDISFTWSVRSGTEEDHLATTDPDAPQEDNEKDDSDEDDTIAVQHFTVVPLWQSTSIDRQQQERIDELARKEEETGWKQGSMSDDEVDARLEDLNDNYGVTSDTDIDDWTDPGTGGGGSGENGGDSYTLETFVEPPADGLPVNLLFYFPRGTGGERAQKYISDCLSELFSVEPFKSFSSRFAVYRIAKEQVDPSLNGFSVIIRSMPDDDGRAVHYESSHTIYMFRRIDCFPHEMGHVFRLDDEYEEEGKDTFDYLRFNASLGFSSDNCTWARFFGLPQYDNRVWYYKRRNGYVPSFSSIMSNSQTEHFFNAPSRWGIYRGLRSLQDGNSLFYADDSSVYEDSIWGDFLEWDRRNDEIPY